MKLRAVLIFLFASMLFVRADDDTISIPDLVQGAKQWAQDNLDTNVLAALPELDTNAVNSLPELDQEKVRQFLQDIQRRFNGEYVVDIAQVKQAAIAIMPVLESYEETQPYAAWLKANLDYLDVADDYSLTNPPPKVEPGQPSKPLPNPTQASEREIWIKKVAPRPWPEVAKTYVPQLKPIFVAQKVPAELVWIAEVESSFDRRAYSPAGAAGLFQLMPDTAKQFGLSLWPRDQRYQIEPSATASAQYLKSLYDRFKDWRLALAAYNAGEGTVQKLLDRYHTKDFDVIAPHLPAETQMYVPRVEAVILRREGVAMAKLSVPQS